MNQDLKAIYLRVAQEFAVLCDKWFDSEDSLTKLYSKHFKAIPFSQTDNWNIILRRELQETWDKYGTGVANKLTTADVFNILHFLSVSFNAAVSPLLEFNILTQVYCNLQPTIRYYVPNSAEELRLLESKYSSSKDSIFAKGAKMKKGTQTQVDIEYNRDLSTLRALRTLANASSSVSYRVTPKGSTPAFADSANYSTLGEGADKFLLVPLEFTAYTVSWQVEPEVAMLVTSPNKYRVFDNLYYSKSGGSVLNTTMWSRLVASVVIKTFSGITRTMVLPRMNSVLLIMSNELVPEYGGGSFSTIIEEHALYTYLGGFYAGFSVIQGARPIPEVSKTVEEEISL